MSHLIVKSQRPLQWSLSIVALSILIAALTWFMLDKGHWSLIYDRLGQNHNYRILLESKRKLEDENKNLQERVLMLERTASVDKKTAALLQDELKDMQDEIYRLKGELEFYQGIMSAAGDATGLNIHGIHIESLPQKQNYRLKLILTRVAKGDMVAQGTLSISFEGKQDGAAKVYNIQEITLDNPLELKFSFRNFKRFESNLVLPEGFRPRKVYVYLQLRDGNQAKIKKVFDWPL